MYLFNPAMFPAAQTPDRSSPGWKWRVVLESLKIQLSVKRKAQISQWHVRLCTADRNCQM